MFGDSQPHLFVYHWVNGESTCYDTCGYVSTTENNPVGNPVTVGQSGTFAIKFANDKWNVIYDGSRIGYFPESDWSVNFTKVGVVQVFGEVSAPAGVPPTSQMGNAILGSQPGAAQIAGFRLIQSRDSSHLSPYVYGNTQSYTIGNITRTSFKYGGPGGYS
jgi:hypothetical protein